ncbi:hypothetical protein [Cerasicoccus frondis]|uniref:hypothetical protein n=1 Tax=Cerasicoccus frondis TaxID=490090 RepID=UPI0028526486|nr:hypothetical protein [Cerasicoccus frondis]
METDRQRDEKVLENDMQKNAALVDLLNGPWFDVPIVSIEREDHPPPRKGAWIRHYED